MDFSEKELLPWTMSDGAHMIYGSGEDDYQIRLECGLIYASKDGFDLHADMLFPRHPKEGRKYPLVIFVPGSGWRRQDLHGSIPNLVEIAREGYVVASMEYRSIDDGFRFPSQAEDAKSCVRFFRLHADEYHIDPERIAICGSSSGGSTALLSGMTDDTLFSPEGSPVSSRVNCIVDFYGPTDMRAVDLWPKAFPSTTKPRWGEEGRYIKLFGGTKEEKGETVKAASPIEYVTKERAIPPILIFHGDHDSVVYAGQSISFYEKLRENGKEAELYLVRNAGHGVRFWIPEVFSVMKRFLRAYL